VLECCCVYANMYIIMCQVYVCVRGVLRVCVVYAPARLLVFVYYCWITSRLFQQAGMHLLLFTT
jgi:hypothetical protein